MAELWPYLLCGGAGLLLVILVFWTRSEEAGSEYAPPEERYQQSQLLQPFDNTLNLSTTNELPLQLRLDELDLLKVYNGLPGELDRDRMRRLVCAFSNLTRDQQNVLLGTAQQFWRDQRPYSG